MLLGKKYNEYVCLKHHTTSQHTCISLSIFYSNRKKYLNCQQQQKQTTNKQSTIWRCVEKKSKRVTAALAIAFQLALLLAVVCDTATTKIDCQFEKDILSLTCRIDDQLFGIRLQYQKSTENEENKTMTLLEHKDKRKASPKWPSCQMLVRTTLPTTDIKNKRSEIEQNFLTEARYICIITQIPICALLHDRNIVTALQRLQNCVR